MVLPHSPPPTLLDAAGLQQPHFLQQARDAAHDGPMQVLQTAGNQLHRPLLPLLLRLQLLQTALVDLVQTQIHVCTRLHARRHVAREDHACHVAVVAVDRRSAVDENILFESRHRSHIAGVDHAVVARVLDELRVAAAGHLCGERHLRAAQLHAVFKGSAQTVFDADHRVRSPRQTYAGWPRAR